MHNLSWFAAYSLGLVDTVACQWPSMSLNGALRRKTVDQLLWEDRLGFYTTTRFQHFCSAPSPDSIPLCTVPGRYSPPNAVEEIKAPSAQVLIRQLALDTAWKSWSLELGRYERVSRSLYDDKELGGRKGGRWSSPSQLL
jgi:hypothetical protein